MNSFQCTGEMNEHTSSYVDFAELEEASPLCIYNLLFNSHTL